MNAPPLTIVVPVFNEAGRTYDLMDHLEPLRCDVVVVDGGSTDGTYQMLIARTGSRLRIIQSGRGRALQMNAGASAANTPLLLFLHA